MLSCNPCGQNSVANDDYSLDITPAVRFVKTKDEIETFLTIPAGHSRFALGLMIILVSLSVILDISKNLKEKAAPILETLRSMAPASSARWKKPFEHLNKSTETDT